MTWAPDIIRATRVALGDTQEAFARRLGIAFTTVNRWEKGRSVPSKMAQEKLDALARPSA